MQSLSLNQNQTVRMPEKKMKFGYEGEEVNLYVRNYPRTVIRK